MLLILMYHRVNDSFTGADFELFKAHMHYIKNNFNVIGVGEPIVEGIVNVCLTFDDAFFDFYHNAYPLLCELNLKSTVAVPVKFILPSTKLNTTTRLSVPYPQGLDGDYYRTHVPFCTYEELKIMSDSGMVNIASHSFSHCHVDREDTDLRREIINSKQVLEHQLQCSVNTFIYPFGDMNKKVQKIVAKNYQYAMRIGSAINKNWQAKENLYYRVDAENFWKKRLEIGSKDIFKFKYKYLINKLRGK